MKPLAWILAIISGAMIVQADHVRTFFDEDDAAGVGYYDASIGFVQAGSRFTLGGPYHDKLCLTTQSFSGKSGGLLHWESKPGGKWKLVIGQPGFSPPSLDQQGRFEFVVNGPKPIDASLLPQVALEISPKGSTSEIPLSRLLVNGLDADETTWQHVSVPLSAFQRPSSLRSNRFLGFAFLQGRSDGAPHTIWIDQLRFVSKGQPASGEALPRPANLKARPGDQSVSLSWDPGVIPDLAGFAVERRQTVSAEDSWIRLTQTPIVTHSFADLDVPNANSYTYRVRAIDLEGNEGPVSSTIAAVPAEFASDSDFLELLQGTAFDFFWCEANPDNGLIRHRTQLYSPASIAALGYGLTALGIGIDHKWISREAGRERALTALRSLWQLPQGNQSSDSAGSHGWFYQFLDMGTGLRVPNSDLSSLDTSILLAGIIYAGQFFAENDPKEAEIRQLADAIIDRVDWQWMARGGKSLSQGWTPEAGFSKGRWGGYNASTILYLIGLGVPRQPLPAESWSDYTRKYRYQEYFNLKFVVFPPLFGHQTAQAWVDFRDIADPYMRERNLTYFENSRRATLAQQAYGIQNPRQFAGYGPLVWGWTTCDGPGFPGTYTYVVRGAPPSEHDDGTVAPSAPGGSLAFTPRESTATLRHLYGAYRKQIWSGYGFRSAFNLRTSWWSPDVLGTDQGAVLLAAENLRSERVWKVFMKSGLIQRALQRAEFRHTPVQSVTSTTLPRAQIAR